MRKTVKFLLLSLFVLMSGVQLLAMNAVITSSSVEGGKSELQPENVMDGNFDSRWSSEFADPQWLQVDLGKKSTIYGVQIVWEAAYCKEYSVSVSLDGKKWEKVFETKNGAAGPLPLNFKTAKEMQFLKIDMVKRGTEWGNSILEIEFNTVKGKPFVDPKEVLKLKMEELSKRKWKLVWQDEFNGTAVDKTKWNFIVSGGGFGNGEKQFYTDRPENVFLKDGSLVMKALQESYKGEEYTSAKLQTEGKGDWLYGKFEARAKMPYGKGIWPAFWMMPTGYDKNYGSWPMCGEIDIMEYLGHDQNTIYGTLHFGNPHLMPGQAYKLPNNKSYADDYHVFTLEWDPGEMRWYVDGNLYSIKTDWFTTAPGASWPAPFDQKFYIQLNLAVGGGWPGYPDATTTFPQSYMVDYVRVYELDGAYPKVERKPFAFQIPKRKPLEDGNYIYNGDFSSPDLKEWTLGNYEGGDSSMSVIDGKLKVDIKNGGGQEWAIQANQTPIFVMQNTLYKVKFDASATSPRDIVVAVNQSVDPWASYSGKKKIKLTTEMKTYDFVFRMKGPSDREARLEFDLGMDDSPVTLDNISFRTNDDPNVILFTLQKELQIEAEDYDNGAGVNAENCQEGGQNLGWFDVGDYIQYNVNVQNAGMYNVDFRLSTEKDVGSFDLYNGEQKLASVVVNNTGGWQNWQTQSVKVNLEAGVQKLIIKATGPEFNINWIKLKALSSKKPKKKAPRKLK